MAPEQDLPTQYVMLEKDKKPICYTRCTNLNFAVPKVWSIVEFRPKAQLCELKLPCCKMYPEPQKTAQRKEWGIFTDWLHKTKMVAIVRSESSDFYILPSKQRKELTHVEVLYRTKNRCSSVKYREVAVSGRTLTVSKNTCADMRLKIAKASGHDHCNAQKLSRADVDSIPCEFVGDSTSVSHATVENFGEKILVRTSPSYLKTLGQAHGWAFGAIAELVDNSRDARATKLYISIEYLHFGRSGEIVPLLTIIDDGHGMSHNEIVRMLSLGHKPPDGEDPDYIGRFGVGFKTGAMKLGRDVVVLTQTSSSRSVALLSQSLNKEKENLEIPIVTYCRRGSYMEIDLNIQSETSASNYLKAIKDYSPFNEYLIGEKFGLFNELASGTQIYIWNLEEWGSDYTLEWDNITDVKGVSCQSYSDILIRSRRIRSRMGQISQKVPLDYSLMAYLEVIFLEPRMKIYVQGSLVKSRPLAKTLSKTKIVKGHVMGKPIQLTVGSSQVEWERANGGIFLYWHGRLIEAYKRVGGMIHNADMGRGVIGVVDVSNLMDDGKGHVWVLNNKQGFQDCEAYAKLEEWLGNKADEYWDANFDVLDLRKGSIMDKPDHEWVQCDKCRKWRILTTGFDSKTLPKEWFCYMPPFNGKCETPEQEAEPGVVTISVKRSQAEARIDSSNGNYAGDAKHGKFDLTDSAHFAFGSATTRTHAMILHKSSPSMNPKYSVEGISGSGSQGF